MFQKILYERSKKINSKIILALDVDPNLDPSKTFSWCKNLIDILESNLLAIKIGYPLLLTQGLSETKKLINYIKNKDPNMPIIGDFKVADIDITNQIIADKLSDIGFDAIIFHLFVGLTGGYESLIKTLHERKKASIGVVYMSHPGAEKTYEKIYQSLTIDAVKNQIQGLVVPATNPKIISNIKKLVGNDVFLLATGIGTQGGNINKTIELGADYVIIGRSIYLSKDPLKSLKNLQSN